MVFYVPMMIIYPKEAVEFFHALLGAYTHTASMGLPKLSSSLPPPPLSLPLVEEFYGNECRKTLCVSSEYILEILPTCEDN